VLGDPQLEIIGASHVEVTVVAVEHVDVERHGENLPPRADMLGAVRRHRVHAQIEIAAGILRGSTAASGS
jgi:hypothetical protein